MNHTGEHRALSQGLAAQPKHWLEYLWRPVEMLREVRRADLAADLLAGLTVAAVAIPQAIGYASVAELPAAMGLYTAALAAIVGALWGSSRFLSTGPTNATSLLVLYLLLQVASPDTPSFLLAASTLAVMAGVFRIVLALLRFGALVTLTSRSVLLGFASGAAVLISLGQLKHLLRLDLGAEPEVSQQLTALLAHLSDAHLLSLAVGVGTLVFTVLLKRMEPRLPAAFLVLIAVSVAVWALGYDSELLLVGALPRSLPGLTWIELGSWPRPALIRQLAVPAMAVAALGLVEAVAAAQSLARITGEHLDNNQEFFGQGMANLVSGLFSGYPCSGSLTRTALNHATGARSGLSGVFTGLALLLSILVLAPLAAHIPRAAVAGILLVVAWNMLDFEGIRRVWRTSRSEAFIALGTFVATLTLPLEFAILSGIIASLAFFVIRSSLPRVYPVVPDPTFRHFIDSPDLPSCPQVGILNIRGPLFFGAVYHVEEALRRHHEEHPGQITLVLRMHGVDLIDLSGIEMLEATVRTYRELGGNVYLIRPREPVLERMRDSGFLAYLGEDHVLRQEGAVEFLFEHMLDPDVCRYECEYRVFAECQALEKHDYDENLPQIFQGLDPALLLGPFEGQELLETRQPLVVDVREPAEYQRAHLHGAVLLPLSSLIERRDELPRDRPLLLYCRSGRRSARAMAILSELGYPDLHCLRGGLLSWRAAGLPFELEPAPELPAR